MSVQIKRDRNTGNPRGFGFVVMRTEEMVDLLMRDNREHKLHNHNITVRKAVTNGVPTNQQKPPAYAEKPAYHHQEEQHYDDYSTGDLPPRDYQRKESSIESAKLFVGGLSWESTEEIIGRYFDRFGDVASVRIMRHPSTGVARGFAFVEFKNDETVDIVLQNKPHEIDKKIVDVKRAAAKGVPVPREREMPREREVYREREIPREREVYREREVRLISVLCCLVCCVSESDCQFTNQLIFLYNPKRTMRGSRQHQLPILDARSSSVDFIGRLPSKNSVLTLRSMVMLSQSRSSVTKSQVILEALVLSS